MMQAVAEITKGIGRAYSSFWSTTSGQNQLEHEQIIYCLLCGTFLSIGLLSKRKKIKITACWIAYALMDIGGYWHKVISLWRDSRALIEMATSPPPSTTPLFLSPCPPKCYPMPPLSPTCPPVEEEAGCSEYLTKRLQTIHSYIFAAFRLVANELPEEDNRRHGMQIWRLLLLCSDSINASLWTSGLQSTHSEADTDSLFLPNDGLRWCIGMSPNSVLQI